VKFTHAVSKTLTCSQTFTIMTTDTRTARKQNACGCKSSAKA